MRREIASGSAPKARATQLAVLAALLVGLGAALDRAVGLLWQRSTTTIDTSVDPALTLDAEDEWEQLLEGGDTAAGQRLFFDPARATRCAACHAFKGRGERTAPNLTESARMPLQRLIREVVDPAFSLSRGFESATLTTADGRVITGQTEGREHSAKLSLRRDDGTVFEVPRTEVEEIQYTSAMPTNYAELLTLQDWRDLVAFLRTGLEQPPHDVPKPDRASGSPAPTPPPPQ